MRCVQMLPVVKDFLAPNGEWVLDFGQNITGVVHAKLDLPAGAQVRLRHAESLDENGNFYTGNLSFAKSEDTFRSAGQPAEYLPRFTCHGFRYLCVEGLPESQRDPAAFTACVLTTDLRRTGQFRCSDERVNQLQSNIQWSQQDNFLEVPTDCPQRSERLGWTGDIRAYGCTALFNSDAALFLKKWLRDLAADQGEDGILPLQAEDVVLIGEMARTMRYQGSGSSHINPTRLISLCEAWPQAPFVPGCDTKGNVTEESLAQTAAAAKSAKVAVVCAGLPDLYESEGFDRETMAMPEGHVRLIETVAAANPNTVVVLFCGSAVETPWIDRVKAVLYMGLPGQAGGEAAAALLTGTANPGGKLTETWPLSYDQVPSRDTFGQKVTRYKEGLYVGYRYYDTAGVPVRYPFGYGLSYTRFAYSDLTVENRTVRVAVTNIGDCPGAEVAQLYIAPPRTGPYRPAKELKGFARVYLTPGESRTVDFPLDDRSFAIWSDGWKVPAGTYTLLVGSSSADIRLQQEIEMPGADLPAPAWQAGSWYETLQGLPTDDEFAALYGSPLQDDPPLEPGRFSMEDSIMEMKDFSPLMMQAFRGTEATIAQGFGGKADYSNPDFRMMIMSGADAPLRAAVLSSGGSFPAAAAQGLLAAANGQTDGPA